LIFDQENVAVSVLAVLRMEQQNVQKKISNRTFGALSFRYDSDAEICFNGQSYDVSHSICYFPAQISYERMASRDHMIVIHFQSHTYFSDRLEMFTPQNPEVYRGLFEEALECWNSGDKSAPLMAASVLYRIFALAHQENQQQQAVHPLVRSALQLIRAGYLREDFQVAEVARQLHISEVYLRRLFQQEAGISPKQYILRRRMERAVSLLGMDEFTVEEVARMSGFHDPKHFSVEFKKRMRQSPSEYAHSFRLKPAELSKPLNELTGKIKA